MATTSMRPQTHCLQTPLKTLNRGNHFLRANRSSITGKHKSAVELLQETKCLYVKSETVLDHHQQLKSPLPPESEFVHSGFVKHSRGPPVPPKSPHLVTSSLRRSYNSTNSSADQLQTKLRRLLNADSKENLLEDTNTDIKKSPRWYRRCNSQSQEKTLTSAQVCPVHHKSLPDLHSGVSSSSDSSEPASCEYTLYSNRKSSSPRQSPGDALSLNSSRSRSRHSRSHSHESSNSSSNERLPPMSPVKSSISYGGSAGKTESLWTDDDGVRLRPILRSKSDVGRRYSKLTTLSQPPPTPADLETFFDQLGLDSNEYNMVTKPQSQTSSPVFFSDTSSVDSQTLCSVNQNAGGSGGVSNQITELPSIVERNARIIKWLCNCRKVQSSNSLCNS